MQVGYESETVGTSYHADPALFTHGLAPISRVTSDPCAYTVAMERISVHIIIHRSNSFSEQLDPVVTCPIDRSLGS